MKTVEVKKYSKNADFFEVDTNGKYDGVHTIFDNGDIKDTIVYTTVINFEGEVASNVTEILFSASTGIKQVIYTNKFINGKMVADGTVWVNPATGVIVIPQNVKTWKNSTTGEVVTVQPSMEEITYFEEINELDTTGLITQYDFFDDVLGEMIRNFNISEIYKRENL